MVWQVRLIVVLLLSITFAHAYTKASRGADNQIIIDPGSTTTMRSRDVGAGVQSVQHIIGDTTGAALSTPTAGADGVSNTATGLLVSGRCNLYNGTTWDRCLGDTTSGLWVNVKSIGTVTVTGTVAATQSGTWNITNVSGTVSLPTGASTSALQSTINTTLGSPFQAGGSIGNTSFLTNPLTAGAWGVGAAGSAVPTSASYTGLNVAGTMRGATASNPIGTVYSQQIDLSAVSGSPVVTGHGTAAGAIRVELPTDGTGAVSVSNTVNVACTSGCSASSSTTAGTPGQTVPVSADYIGINVAGNIRAPTGTNPIGSVYSQQIDLSAVSGSPVVTGAGTAAGAIRVELPTNGTGLVTTNPATAANWSIGATGSAVPANSIYNGVNVAGTMRGATATNPIGSVYSQQIDLAAVSGSPVVTGHGTAAGAIRVELPTDSTGVIGATQSGAWSFTCSSGCTAGSATTAGTPGSTVPVSADYIGVNVGGTIRGATAVNPYGTVYAQHMDLTSVGGSATVTGSGTATGAIRVELPTNGTGLVTVNPATAVSWGITNTGLFVPTTAVYAGVNVGANLRGVTGVNPIGSVYAPQMDLASVSGSPVVTGAGTAAGAIRVELPTNGTGLVTTNPGTAANWGVGATGSAVPANGVYEGINVAGTMRGATGTNPIGSVYTQQIDLSAVSGSPIVTGAGTAAGAIRVELPTNGTGQVAANLNQINGTTIVNGGVAGSQSVGGTVATNVAITANPLNLGAQAVSSENSAVTTARQVQLVADLVGKLIVLPYANPENFVSGVVSSSMTGTTVTQMIASPGGSLRNYITSCQFSNAHATQGTDIYVLDGSDPTKVLVVIPAAAVYGGAVVTFPTPIRQTVATTAAYVQNVTSGASTRGSCQGYKGL